MLFRRFTGFFLAGDAHRILEKIAAAIYIDLADSCILAFPGRENLPALGRPGQLLDFLLDYLIHPPFLLHHHLSVPLPVFFGARGGLLRRLFGRRRWRRRRWPGLDQRSHGIDGAHQRQDQ